MMAMHIKPTTVKRLLSACLAIFLIVLLIAGSIPLYVSAASAPTIRTTLTDGAVQKGSRKTFDVWARDGQNHKIEATVTFNGTPLSPTWNDSDKASYMLEFTREGKNTVVVKASAGGKTISASYTITYQKAQKGEVIGQAVWSVELFTIGCGYLVEPVKVDIREGENAADSLIRVLHEQGYVAYYGGSLSKSFYLAYIGDGTQTRKKYNGYTNSRNENGTPASPKAMNLHPQVPSVLDKKLHQLYEDNELNFYDPDSYGDEEGYIGEFVISSGSGWMYSINNEFPNVSFSDNYLADGDVVRVQYTLAYGHDIGGAGATGGGGGGSASYYTIANKDSLTRLMAQVRASSAFSDAALKAAYHGAAAVAMTVDASQSRVNSAYNSLNTALLEAETPPSSTPSPPPSSVPASSSDGSSPPPTESTPPTSKPTTESSATATETSSSAVRPPTESEPDSPSTAPNPSSTVSSGDPTGAPSGSPESTDTSRSESGQQTASDAPDGPSGETSETPAGVQTVPGRNPSDGSEAEPSSMAWVGWLVAGILVVGAGAGGTILLLHRKRKQDTQTTDRNDDVP